MISDTQQRTALVLPKHQDTAGGGLFGKGDALRCAARVVPSFSELVWERKQCAAGSAGCPHPANENHGLRSTADAHSSPDKGVRHFGLRKLQLNEIPKHLQPNRPRFFRMELHTE
jgi:hypothetical protein